MCDCCAPCIPTEAPCSLTGQREVLLAGLLLKATVVRELLPALLLPHRLLLLSEAAAAAGVDLHAAAVAAAS
jgi:hypothetical protein